MRMRLATLARVVTFTGALLAMISVGTGAAFQATSGLVGYWALDETGGTTAADSSGNNNTGTHTNSPTIAPAGDVAPTPSGNARSLIFDAAAGQQHVRVSDSASLKISGPITLAAWIKPTAATPNEQKGIIEKWTYATDIDGYMLRLSWSNTGNMVPVFALGNGTTQVSTAGPPELTPGVWKHVAGVYDGTNLVLYLDGQVRATTPNSGAGAILPTVGNVDPLHIGKDYGMNVFTGNIDEARVYNRALTAAEIGVLVNGQPPPTNLVATAGVNSVDLSWTAAAGATSYIVQVGPSSNGPWSTIGSPTGTTFTDTNATWPNTYWYQVIAVSSMQSAPAGPVSASPNSPLPRFDDHEEGFFDGGKCTCGTTAPASTSAGLALGLLLLAGFALLKRR